MRPLSSQFLPAMPTVLTVAIVFASFIYMLDIVLGFPWWLSGKEFTCSAEDLGLIPGLGRSPKKGMAIHSSILAWRISWTEEPGGL